MTTPETRTIKKALKRQSQTWQAPCAILRRLQLDRLFTRKEAHG